MFVQIAKKTCDGFTVVAQERISVDSLGLQVVKVILEEIKDIHQKRISERTRDQLDREPLRES